MKIIFSLVACAGFLLAGNKGFGQFIPGAVGYNEQALMFSNYDYNGTARIQGLGNTQISLGGDISSALSNPAGLGFYNKSEFSFTPSYNNYTANADYLSNSTSTSTGNLNLQNFGLAFHNGNSLNSDSKWRGGTFGISFSKVNNFNSDIFYSGLNDNSDIIDYYAEDANIQNIEGENLIGLARSAFNTYLISEFLDVYIDGTDTIYSPFYERTFFSEFPSPEYPTDQSEIISSTGGQNQWNFSYGGNYGDFLYFGATLGVQTVRYNITKEYTEIYPGLSNDIVLSSFLTEMLETSGTGINGTFGVIARPIDQLTVGFSLITPTKFNMEEYYYTATEANYDDFNMSNYGYYFDANYDLIATNPKADYTTFYNYNATLNRELSEEESTFSYQVTTPMRINLGTTYFLNKNGFLSADLEIIDYANMKVQGKDGSLEGENAEIKEIYTSVINIRAGAEWRLKAFRLRGGYGYSQSPYEDEEIDRSIQTISGGLGVRSKKVFADLAVSYKFYESAYAPYVLENPNFQTNYAQINNYNLNVSLSFGLFF